MAVSWAARTHPGLRRAKNEDRFCAVPERGLFVVADGMGGHAGGDVASELAVVEIERVVRATAALGQHDTWPMPFDSALGRDGNILRAAFVEANQSISDEADASEELRGMATTAVAVLLAGLQATIAHVGDSRAYLLREERLTRLTGDHSWVEEQMRAGLLTAEAAREHPWRNIVTRALSGAGDLEVDVSQIELQPADRLLLCSDGLTTMLTDDDVGRIIDDATDLQRGCDDLVDRANAAGGSDNITTLLLAME
jgi:serine/threonine protein phosphatase PrpC